ncbi:phage integrase N-terminal SAM-like domain-containing protein [Lacrimispora sp.]|jgi:integrase/recombinase XerD|uniref:phage integrase N-terminal SAM-like domain-containing protein n=1 Tax=Lacrimispora sp. TaxID=2719234 RepID=UPI0026C0668C|nr:phage integrase N-terminal SAM-like domain-containing protein [Lacrimispora sp.]
MYEKHLQLLEIEYKIRNLKERSITCYKNHVLYFLKEMNKEPGQLSLNDVRQFLLS